MAQHLQDPRTGLLAGSAGDGKDRTPTSREQIPAGVTNPYAATDAQPAGGWVVPSAAPPVLLRDVNGREQSVPAGDLAGASGFLTEGNCHSFALAIAERTGWDVVAFWDNEPWNERATHFAVLSPQGVVIDGDPPLTLSEVEARTGWESENLGPLPGARQQLVDIVEDARRHGRTWLPLDVQQVASFVTPALDRAHSPDR
jgi:hypothetical protein